jgi:hypothetical protein
MSVGESGGCFIEEMLWWRVYFRNLSLEYLRCEMTHRNTRHYDDVFWVVMLYSLAVEYFG